TVVVPKTVEPAAGAVIETVGGVTSGGGGVALNATSCMTQAPAPVSGALAEYEPGDETIRSSTMSPSGDVIMRAVNPRPGPAVPVTTRLAATSTTFGAVVVIAPVLDVALLPDATAAPLSGLRGSRPLYSRMRTSGYAAAVAKRTVTVLPPPRMF